MSILLDARSEAQVKFCFRKVERLERDLTTLRTETFTILLSNSSVRRQKGEYEKRCFQENKARQILEKTNISYPLEKFGVLCLLEIPVLRFALLPYYQRISNEMK